MNEREMIAHRRTLFCPYRHDVEVRFCDLDGLGHINNAVYHSYFELCRTFWLEATGLWTRRSLDARIPFILARTEIDYLAPGRFHHKLQVYTAVTRIGRKSFDKQYEIRAEAGTPIARGTSTLVWYDYDADSSVFIPTEAREFLETTLCSLWEVKR